MITILLVDDEREEREGISYLIHKYEYPLHIVQATNGKEALEYIQSHEVDILFTDIKMPVMDGLELAKQVYEYDARIKIIIFSAYGEFDYAKQALAANAVSYLLKPIEIEEFCKLMSNVIATVNEEQQRNRQQREEQERRHKNLLYKLFTGAKVEPEEQDEMLHYLFPKNGAQCRLLAVEFMDNFFEENDELFLGYMNTYMGNAAEYVEMYPNEAYIIIRSGELLHRNQLETQLKKLIRDVRSHVKDELLLLIGRVISSMEQFETEIRRFQEVQSKIFSYDDSIIIVDQYYNGQEYYVANLETMHKQLLRSIESGEKSVIQQYNTGLIEVLEGMSKVSRLYVQNLLYTAIRTMYEKNPGIESENALAAAETLFQAKDSKNMLEKYKKAMDNMLILLDSEKTDEPRITQQIKNLIEKEYMKDISLNYVADKVNLAPAYVSYIFKQETGQTLVKYITDVKMQKAKMLLEEGNMKIVQVGRACGYENQSYFNRLFKNYYGITPKQYREKV